MDWGRVAHEFWWERKKNDFTEGNDLVGPRRAISINRESKVKRRPNYYAGVPYVDAHSKRHTTSGGLSEGGMGRVNAQGTARAGRDKRHKKRKKGGRCSSLSRPRKGTNLLKRAGYEIVRSISITKKRGGGGGFVGSHFSWVRIGRHERIAVRPCP